MGKLLNPAFLVFLAVMLVTALVRPVNFLSAVPVSGGYESGAFFTGFLQGYDTWDALASLAFGIIVIRTIRQLGVTEPGAVAVSTVKAGVVSMALICAATALVGAQSYTLYAGEPSNPGFTGGDAFALISRHYFGRGGGPGRCRGTCAAYDRGQIPQKRCSPVNVGMNEKSACRWSLRPSAGAYTRTR